MGCWRDFEDREARRNLHTQAAPLDDLDPGYSSNSRRMSRQNLSRKSQGGPAICGPTAEQSVPTLLLPLFIP